jgi:glycine C-acetyltransferase
LETLEIIDRNDTPLKKLRENTAIMKKALLEQGYNLGDAVKDETPILPVILGTAEAAIKASQFLQENGIFISTIRPPTVPRNESRLRITANALHTPKEIEKLITAFKNLKGILVLA